MNDIKELTDEELEKVKGGFDTIKNNFNDFRNFNKPVGPYDNLNTNNTSTGVSSIGAGNSSAVTNLTLDSWDESTNINK